MNSTPPSQALVPYGPPPPEPQLCARLFAEATRYGVYTHSLARIPRLLSMLQNGTVNPVAEPTLTAALKAVERFLAIDPTHIADPKAITVTATAAIANLHTAQPIDPNKSPRYPGEETLRIWEKISAPEYP